jgi:sodium/pantothenate symporter
MDIANHTYAFATLVMLSVYMALVIYLVVKAARATKSLEAYALGSVSFSPVMVGLSVAASMTSAATFIINPGIIATYGLSAFLSYGVFLPLAALTALVVLSKKFRSHGFAVQAQTLPQWIGNTFNSPALKNWFAILSLLLITFLVLIMVGLTQVISTAIGANQMLVLWVSIAFVFGYMMFGGANALVYTNTLQAIAMVIVAIILLASGADNFANGVSGFINKLVAIDAKLVQVTRPDSPLFRDYFELIIAQLIIGFAVICQPHIITKSLLLKSDKEVNRYLWVAVLVQALFFLVVFAGFYARMQFPDLTQNGTALSTDKIMSAFVVARFPVYVGLLVLFGLIAAGISTLEGLIQSLSTTYVADILKPLFPAIEEPKWFVIHKFVIIGMAIITGLLSMQQLSSPNFSVAMLAQNGVYAFFASAVIPVFCGLFYPKVSSKVILIAAITALLVHFSVYYLELSSYMNLKVKNPAIPASFGIISAIAIVLSLHRLPTFKSK